MIYYYLLFYSANGQLTFERKWLCFRYRIGKHFKFISIKMVGKLHKKIATAFRCHFRDVEN